jgi:CARDB
MRKTVLILTLAAVLTPALAPAAYKLERCYIKSWSNSTSGDAPPAEAGYYELTVDGAGPEGVRGVLSRKGQVLVRDLPITVSNCRDAKARTAGEFRRPAPGAKTTELRLTGSVMLPGERRARICDLSADVPLTAVVPQAPSRPNPGGPGQGGGAGGAPAPEPRPGALATASGVQHSRPNPGGPGQGNFAAPALPNLRIREAEPLDRGRGATQLKVKVVNTGAGPSTPTQLKFMYVKDGATATASAPVPALAANQEVWVNVGSAKPLAAADKVYLRVDDPNKVAETSEADNSFIFKG